MGAGGTPSFFAKGIIRYLFYEAPIIIMKELNRAGIQDDLIKAIMELGDWSTDLKVAVIDEIREKFKRKESK